MSSALGGDMISAYNRQAKKRATDAAQPRALVSVQLEQQGQQLLSWQQVMPLAGETRIRHNQWQLLLNPSLREGTLFAFDCELQQQATTPEDSPLQSLGRQQLHLAMGEQLGSRFADCPDIKLHLELQPAPDNDGK